MAQKIVDKLMYRRKTTNFRKKRIISKILISFCSKNEVSLKSVKSYRQVLYYFPGVVLGFWTLGEQIRLAITKLTDEAASTVVVPRQSFWEDFPHCIRISLTAAMWFSLSINHSSFFFLQLGFNSMVGQQNFFFDNTSCKCANRSSCKSS